MNRSIAIYLAGAIRDGHPEDIAWRERVINELRGLAVFLNPLAGKKFSEGRWSMSGIASTAGLITKHDFWCIDHAHVVLANLTALSLGYPSIGSLIELGRATAHGTLIYTVIDPDYRGHENHSMFDLHPFLDQIAAAHFATVGEAIAFLRRHLESLSGSNPHFDGIQT